MQEEKEDLNLEITPKILDYIILIEKSWDTNDWYSKPVNETVKLFLHSLPLGSKFNII